MSSKSKAKRRNVDPKKQGITSPELPTRSMTNVIKSKPSKGLSKASLSLQRSILDTFSSSFPEQDPCKIKERIQKVKGHLYDRNFAEAFKSKDNQEAYCLRWSPGRALAYLDLLCSLRHVRVLFGLEVEELEGVTGGSQKVSTDDNTVICIGGGAGAEVVAFAGLFELAAASKSSTETVETRASSNLEIVDVADWSYILESLDKGLARDGQRDSTSEISGDQVPGISFNFRHADVLQMAHGDMVSLLTADKPPFITMFFTLNELYSSSMPRTTSFLLALSALTKPGTLLLVVDSPGSYSTVKIGNAENKYRMHWMLDHTLLEASKKGVTEEDSKSKGSALWEKIGSEDSRWWRMNRAELRYNVEGIELEDMRMQWHLYRRV